MSNITFAPFPIPLVVIDENGGKMDAYLIYTESGKMNENDCWTVSLCDSGKVIHVLTNQARIYKNATYGINAESNNLSIEEALDAMTPKRNKKTWTDELAILWSIEWDSIRKLPGVQASDINQYLHTFKLNNNIK